jgi:hypothetical protein
MLKHYYSRTRSTPVTDEPVVEFVYHELYEYDEDEVIRYCIPGYNVENSENRMYLPYIVLFYNNNNNYFIVSL